MYINPELNIINPSSEVLDLGVYMSSNCTFDFHVKCVYKKCSNLSGWILRTFSTWKTRTMMTLLIPGTIPAGLCLTVVVTPSIKTCLPTREGPMLIYTTHHRDAYMSYDEQLKYLNLYSIHRRGDRYQIIYLWKIIEKFVPNLSAPITCTYPERRGRSCAVLHSNVCRLVTYYNSFRWRAIRCSVNCLNIYVWYLLVL